MYIIIIILIIIIVYISGDTAMAEFLESLFLALVRQFDTFTDLLLEAPENYSKGMSILKNHFTLNKFFYLFKKLSFILKIYFIGNIILSISLNEYSVSYKFVLHKKSKIISN